MLKKIIVILSLVGMLAGLGCASTQVQGITASDKTEFDCKTPDGREYWCYSDEECLNYMKGYAVILKHRI